MAVVWLTGPSGAGKSTIAEIVQRRLQRAGRQVAILDGDEVRTGLCSDLGFSVEDRAENIRRVAETARLMVDNGVVVVVAMISPLRASREAARERFPADKFIEVHVDAPIEVTERRDPKGLYKRARAGEISEFTGIDSPYEPPVSPELHLDTVELTPEECAQAVLEALAKASASGASKRRGEMAASD